MGRRRRHITPDTGGRPSAADGSVINICQGGPLSTASAASVGDSNRLGPKRPRQAGSRASAGVSHRATLIARDQDAPVRLREDALVGASYRDDGACGLKDGLT